MLQAKKLNASMIAVVVLSVLLAIAVATGATMAWFASADSSSGKLGLSGAVEISLTGQASGETLGFEHTELVPSRPVPINVGATLTKTNTPSLVRARFLLTPLGDYTVDLSEADNTDLYDEIYEEFFGFLEFDKGVVVADTEYEWGLYQGWYYLGFTTGETGNVAEIDASAGDLTIDIINNKVKTVPHYWGNEFAEAQFTVTLQIEAVQAEFYQTDATTPEGESNDDRVELSIANVAAFFNNVFKTPGQTPVTPESDPGFTL